MANLTADCMTVVMFGAMLISSLQKKLQTAISMVFFIPLLVYAYFLSDFSNSSPPSYTLPVTAWWLIAGTLFLAIFSRINFRYFLFSAGALATLILHISKAGKTAVFLRTLMGWSENPVLIYLAVIVMAAAFRYFTDRKNQAISEQRTQFLKRLNETFRAAKQPAAVIHAEHDQNGDIIRLEVQKVNHAFTSHFRIALHEVLHQELNYIFRYIFRNDTNWNDLLIIEPRQQAELYSAHLERWYTVNMYWIDPTTCLCLFSDISREKKEIRSLEETRNRYQALLEAIPDIFFVIDKDGTYEDIVFKGQSELQTEAGEVIGSTVFDVGFPENMARKIYECIQRAIEFDTIETMEYSLHVQEKILMFEMRIARLTDHSVISIARDISRRKKAEFELERAKIRAEEAVALKSRFLANLSHDIRTPMSLIINMTKLLGEPVLSAFERDEFTQDIIRQGNLLMKMINNTIHLSKIETNTLDLNPAFCPVNPLMRDLYNHFYPMLPDNRNLRLKMIADLHSDEAGFETDPALLREVMEELADNAIRFTDEGTVRFGYLFRNPSTVEFFVEDTGSGIPEDEQENIFLRFYVIERDRRQQKCGAGTGLSIAQHFVALLGGELQMESTPGIGSRFWFELPLVNPKGFMHVIT